MTANFMSDAIHIQAECFGELKAMTGGAWLALTLERPATAARALEAAGAACPGAAGLLARTACARGDTLLARDAELVDGDRIAFIPPVSGG